MKKLLACALLGLASGGVFAQSFVIETETVLVGATSGEVDITFDDEGADVEGIALNVSYDPAELTFTSCNDPDGSSSSLFTCEELAGADSGTVNIGDFGNPDGTAGATVIAVLTFTIDNPNVVATHPLTGVGTVSIGGADQVASVTDGAIVIEEAPPGPTLDADPEMATINTGNTSSGMASSTFTANGGPVGSISCAGTGGDSEISFSASPPATLADGEDFDVTATCSSAATGTFNNSFSCTSDASNSPSTFDVTCNVGMDPADVSSNPSNGSTVTIGPLVPGGSGSAQVTFTNTGGTAATVNSCALATGTSFTLGAVPGTVPAGGSASVTITATAPADGSIPSDTLTCDIDGETFSFPLTIILEPEVVPTMSQWGLILLALSIFGLGFWTLRRRGDVA